MANSLEKFMSKNQRTILWVIAILAVYFFVFHNLTRFPVTWFDEGSHLHVPKTLVRYGVYADISSEGFRYYGPTIGVGPTVMLPVAAMFKLFGIGLLQARLVMALYLIAAVYVFYRLVEHLSGKWVALIAVALIVSSRSVLLLNYGRQLLGEVPGLFFLVLGFYLWFSKWEEDKNWKRLSLIGLLFGLAMITKYQYLLFIAPTLIFSWFLDIFYYKNTSHRNFLIPGIIAAGSFGLWQVFTLQYLGPATVMENLALMRASAEGAAFNFNLYQLGLNLGVIISRAAYLWALIPALIYGILLSLPRTKEGQKWSIIFLLMVLDLAWFVVFSIGWIRYAFLGLSFASMFIARTFYDITGGFKFDWSTGFFHSFFQGRNALKLAVTFWLLAIIMLPTAKNVMEIALPNPDNVREMASYLNENIPQTALIETWDPEMGFMTDHNYHYPPNALLAVAVDQVNYGGEPVQGHYDFVQTEHPDYLLVGVFSKWTEIYSPEQLKGQYEWVVSFGDYELYRRVEQ
jgi:4-amino-4-deoxy-L-arabinose transferase-like glycosyltransferase